MDSRTPHVHNQAECLAALNALKKELLSKVMDAFAVSDVLETIQQWAGGNLFLTRLLCHYVYANSSKIPAKNVVSWVNMIVEKAIIKDWETNGAAVHLQAIRDALLRCGQKDAALILYAQVLQKGLVVAKHTPAQLALLQSGLVTVDNDHLKVTNAIYARIFDLKWVIQQQPNLTQLAITDPESSSFQISYPSSFSKFFSKMMVVSCGVAMLAAVGFTYLRESKIRWASNPTAYEASVYDTSAATSYVSNQQLTQLRILGDTFSGYSTFRNTDFQAALKNVGIEIAYDDEFDQNLRAQKLSEDQADLIVTTLDQFLQHQPQGKIIGLLDCTAGADAVVLNTKRYPSLESLIDLDKLVKQEREKGKLLSITYAADTPSEYLALVLDAKFDDFNLSDFELKPVADASEAWALMQDPEENVAISVLWEPFVTQSRQKGYNVVLSSKDAPMAILDVIVASDRLIESSPNILSSFLVNYYRRIDANARDATQLQVQVAEDGDLSVVDASAIISGTDFFNAIESQNWMDSGILDNRIDATTAVLMLSNRLERSVSNPKALYTDQFLTESVKNSETLIALIKADNPSLAEKIAGTSDTVTPIHQISAAKIQQAPDIGNLQVRGEVSFATGSADLTTEGQQTLKTLSSQLKEFNNQTVAARVIGHTSRTGNPALNQRLSQERTHVVVNYLREMGVTLNILPEGKGFSEPLPNIAPDDDRNQRTEIRLVRVN